MSFLNSYFFLFSLFFFFFGQILKISLRENTYKGNERFDATNYGCWADKENQKNRLSSRARKSRQQYISVTFLIM